MKNWYFFFLKSGGGVEFLPSENDVVAEPNKKKRKEKKEGATWRHGALPRLLIGRCEAALADLAFSLPHHPTHHPTPPSLYTHFPMHTQL